MTSKISHENCNNLSNYDHINHGNQNWSFSAWFWCITEVRRMTRSKEILLLYMSVEEKHCVWISQTCPINQDLNHWHLFRISYSKVKVKQQINHIIESEVWNCVNVLILIWVLLLSKFFKNASIWAGRNATLHTSNQTDHPMFFKQSI